MHNEGMRALTVLSSILILSGCGATPKLHSGTSKSSTKDVRPLPKPGDFFTQGLASFASEVGLPTTSTERRLVSTLRRTLSPPPALDCLAREYAARFGADARDPSPSVVLALAQHCGYWNRPRTQYSVTGTTIEEIEAHLRNLPDQITQGTFGLGSVAHPDGRITVTLLIPSQDIRLKQVNRSGDATIQGHLQSGDGKIEFWVQDAAGAPARKLDATADATGKFSVHLQGNVGAYRVEISRVRGGFRQTVALLHRGAARPKTYTAPRDSNFTKDDYGLAKSFNAQRAVSGQAPLVLEHHLAGPLNDWMTRISKNAGSDTPPGMLDLRGWRYARLDYGFTYGRTPEEAVEILADTPTGHFLLNTNRHERLAVGLLPFKRGPGFDAVIVALSRFEVKAPEDARAALLESMNAARAKAELPALQIDPRLTDATQRAAEAVMSGRLAWENALGSLGKTIAQEKLAAGAFGSGGSTVVELAESSFVTEPSVMTREVNWTGIGVVGGPLPGGGSPRYIIIFVTAEKIPKER